MLLHKTGDMFEACGTYLCPYGCPDECLMNRSIDGRDPLASPLKALKPFGSEGGHTVSGANPGWHPRPNATSAPTVGITTCAVEGEGRTLLA